MNTTTDVLVVGGGPVGLMLACELQLSGVTPLVIEALERPTGLSKALGIQGSGVELLDLRGLLPRFGPAALRTHGLSHFGGIRFEPPMTGGRQPRFLYVPQARTEEILAERAAELGVEVHRGCELIHLTPGETSVLAGIRTPRGELTVEARYLAGCDGAHSRVRKLAGVAFPGLEPTLLLRWGDVKIDAEISGGPGELTVDGKPAPFRFGVPLDDGWLRVVTSEPYEKGFDRETQMTLEELQASVDRVTPGMPRLKEARWLSRSTDSSRIAETYRVGRVLLAGDAAHIHLPAGGPGLATGVGDAANLGWKLAAVVQGWAPDALLDSYHLERHAAGDRVMLHTRAQGALMNKTPQVAALREVIAALLQYEQASRFTIDLLQGIDDSFVSRLEVDTVNGKRPLSELLLLPRGLLLDARGNAAQHPRIDVVRVTSGPSQLVRPDGLVAWREGEGTFEEAARRWFG